LQSIVFSFGKIPSYNSI